MADIVYPPVLAFARSVFALQGLRFTLTGTEHIPPAGGAVLAINHIGYFDFTYAGYAALPRKRVVRFMAKQEVFAHPVSGPLMRGMKHIPVDRKEGAASYRKALEALRSGELIGVFPEATISRSFELKEFKSGAARMAAAAKVPLVPVVIWGSQRVWTKDVPKRLGRTRTPITISVGEPVPTGSDPAATTALLRERMTAQLHRVQESYPDKPGPEGDWWLPARLGGSAPTPERAAELDAEEAARRAARKAAG
ncbi:MAG TPA: lysophospholipid acyltransferase family protein [Mycobacteriales bacterium]